MTLRYDAMLVLDKLLYLKHHRMQPMGKVSSQTGPGMQQAALELMFSTCEDGVGLVMKETADR